MTSKNNAGRARRLVERRGLEGGPLVHHIHRSGHVKPNGIMPTAVYNIINQRAEQVGIAKLAPHDGRRTFASELLDNGADIVTVQKLMAWVDQPQAIKG